MKTALIQRYSIRVKMRNKGIELVVMDSRNGDIYYYQLDIPSDREPVEDTDVTPKEDVDIPEDKDESIKEEVVNGETVHD